MRSDTFVYALKKVDVYIRTRINAEGAHLAKGVHLAIPIAKYTVNRIYTLRPRHYSFANIDSKSSDVKCSLIIRFPSPARRRETTRRERGIREGRGSYGNNVERFLKRAVDKSLERKRAAAGPYLPVSILRSLPTPRTI